MGASSVKLGVNIVGEDLTNTSSAVNEITV